jgi:hypothetical protein
MKYVIFGRFSPIALSACAKSVQWRHCSAFTLNRDAFHNADAWLLPSIRKYGDTFSAVEKIAHPFLLRRVTAKAGKTKIGMHFSL